MTLPVRRILAAAAAFGVLTACAGQPVAPDTPASARPEMTAAQVLREVTASAVSLTHNLREAENLRATAGRTSSRCRPVPAAEVSYEADLTVRPERYLTVGKLLQVVTDVLQSAGWHQKRSKERLPLGPPHPVYLISQGSLTGVLNILPSAQTGAEGLIFIHSPCLGLPGSRARPGSKQHSH